MASNQLKLKWTPGAMPNKRAKIQITSNVNNKVNKVNNDKVNKQTEGDENGHSSKDHDSDLMDFNELDIFNGITLYMRE